MIEGNLKDVGLPGLLQFLGTEGSKNYRVRITGGGQTGEIYVCHGFVVAAAFGLLEGEDALCEFLSFREGTFWVETLNLQFEVKKNLKRAVQPSLDFVDHCLVLAQESVGLNAILVSSKNFGTLAWQESLRHKPLEREDFVVLGWLGEGRSMRQALREFGFDVVQATAILFRLLQSGSIQVLRASAREAVFTAQTEAEGEPQVDPVVQRFVETGGQEAAAANVAQAAAKAYQQEAAAAVAQDAFISTSYKPPPVSPPKQDAKAQSQTGQNAIKNPIKKIGVDLAAIRASMEARLKARTSRKLEPTFEGMSQSGQPQPPPQMASPASPAQPYAKADKSSGSGNFAADPFFSPSPGGASNTSNNRGASSVERSSSAVETSESLHAVPASNAYPGRPDPGPALLGQPASALSSAPGELLINPLIQPGSSALAANLPSSPSGSSEQTAVAMPAPAPSAAVKVPEAMPIAQTLSHPSASSYTMPTPKPAPTPTPPQPGAGSAQSSSAAPNAVPTHSASGAPSKAAKVTRTEALPLVTIDIERLLQATFSPTQFGKLALANPALDLHRRHTLMDVEAGKSLALVISEGTRPPAAILSSYRYCLDRGYIETIDPVIPLTADLLLGRMEIDQYLLQRRRITGDELRDLVEAARKEGVRLTAVMVRGGYLTPGDLDTLEREQRRFAFK